jgi:hypothetical protein
MKPRISVGRLTVWLWNGSWTWKPSHLHCAQCRNVYLGPFGLEWGRHEEDEQLSDNEDQWVEETRKTHFYNASGVIVKGYGSSMDPHRCGHPDEPCWTITEKRKVTPWKSWKTEAK